MAKGEIKKDLSRFRKTVLLHYKKQGRHDLPWRQTHDLYQVLVSEVMLQQTQVDRVVPLYKDFIKKFPTAKKLAKAPLSEVLKSWQGLGYNRRAKMLHQAAKVLSAIARFDLDITELEELPGVGPYTARAVAAFANNQDVVVIETNIRTSVIHHFFPKKKKISDTEIEKILRGVLPKGKARAWYSALMDYGAHLKRSGISHNARSSTHTVQKKFAGSLREARGAVLRELSHQEATRASLCNILGPERRLQVTNALVALVAEGLISVKNRRYSLASD